MSEWSVQDWLLFIGALLNWLLNPTRAVLERLDVTEYRQDATA